MSTLQQWKRIAALANANPADDAELAERALRFGAAFQMFDIIGGRIGVELSPVLAAEARAVLPELRVLLRALLTERGMKKAESIVVKHERHVKAAMRRWSRGGGTTGSGSMDDFLKAFKGRSRKSFRDRKYLDPLDPVCESVRDDVFARGRKPGLGPVRVCKLQTCRKFFVRGGYFARRGGRGCFCSDSCKWTFHNRTNNAERRDKQIRHRAEKMPREAIQIWIEKAARRKMPPARKRRLLTILRRVLENKYSPFSPLTHRKREKQSETEGKVRPGAIDWR